MALVTGTAPYPLGRTEANRAAGKRPATRWGNRSHRFRVPQRRVGRETAGRFGRNGQNYDRQQKTVGDDRQQCDGNQLLGLYSRNVARGIWRDYAIDHRDGQALFSVFRHTHESAAYTIVKSLGPGHGAAPAEFAVLSGRQRLRAGCSLGDALEYFRSKLTAVPSGPR